MKVRAVAVWAGLGMLVSSAAAMAIPTPHPAVARVEIPATPPIRSEPKGDDARFTAGQTLTVDARLGHATVAQNAAGETFLFASVAASDSVDTRALATPPLSLAIVVDRSGSMKGDRIANAIAAAVGTIDRMRDGDMVTVVSFDTAADVVVAPTEITSQSRAAIQQSIRGIRLGGDTCISCGLEAAMAAMERAPFGADRVSRMLLLSDGATNHGIKDAPGLRALAGRMRDRGFSISTIGVDVDFDEKVMAALAQESNGRHYFVANPSGLAAIFAQEFDALVATLARETEMAVDLAPGIEVEQVFDRAFRRQGSKVIIPFGTFSAKQEKTVLMKVRVAADHDGVMPVAAVKLTYRDLLKRTDGTCEGKLALHVTSDGSEQKDVDPFVAARLARSRTSRTLTDANLLFEQGRVDDARGLLASQTTELKKEAASTSQSRAKAPKPMRAMALEDDFASQINAVAEAETNFAPPPADKGSAAGVGGGAQGFGRTAGTGTASNAAPTTRPAAAPAAAAPAPANRDGKAAVRKNQQNALDMAF